MTEPVTVPLSVSPPARGEIVLELRSDQPDRDGEMYPFLALTVLEKIADPGTRASILAWLGTTRPSLGEIRFVHVDDSGVPRLGFFLKVSAIEDLWLSVHDTLEYLRQRGDWAHLREQLGDSECWEDCIPGVRQAIGAAYNLCAAAAERGFPDTQLGLRLHGAAQEIECFLSPVEGRQRPPVDQVARLFGDLAAYEGVVLGRDWWNPDRSALGHWPPLDSDDAGVDASDPRGSLGRGFAEGIGDHSC